ncbi:ankyrin repeat domain-containing protein 17-like [Corticium candelabrum]|uniref:ankyrin repeat domain-containing protein 17-like n=1 Tax=Corticium candelabrum TaxID=121492 RepID=UPI002E26A830|nr:ankyrin repeat domain-containing protein 17-like [Corticium candelabrum]
MGSEISIEDEVRRGDVNSVTRLLENGVNVNARCLYGETILTLACRKKKKEIVELLLAKSADVNETNETGWTSLITAAEKGCEEIIDVLVKVEGINVMKKERYGKTAIHYAARNNHVTIVERLLSCSVPVDVMDNDGRTPLWFAARGGHGCCVDVLLKHGASPQHKSKHRSPLKIAKQYGHSCVAKMMEKAIRLGSHLYVERDVSIMRRQYEQKITELQREVEKMTEELRQSSLVHESEVTRLREEIQQKENEIRRLRMSAVDRQLLQAGEDQVAPEAWLLSQPPGDVMRAVVALAGDQWSDVGLELGYKMSQLNSITSSIPTPSGKLNAILSKKADSVGARNVVRIILSACQQLPMSICAAAITDEVGNHRDLRTQDSGQYNN